MRESSPKWGKRRGDPGSKGPFALRLASPREGPLWRPKLGGESGGAPLISHQPPFGPLPGPRRLGTRVLLSGNDQCRRLSRSGSGPHTRHARTERRTRRGAAAGLLAGPRSPVVNVRAESHYVGCAFACSQPERGRYSLSSTESSTTLVRSSLWHLNSERSHCGGVSVWAW